VSLAAGIRTPGTIRLGLALAFATAGGPGLAITATSGSAGAFLTGGAWPPMMATRPVTAFGGGSY